MPNGETIARMGSKLGAWEYLNIGIMRMIGNIAETLDLAVG